ncbi:MAG: PQQ-like beta-propeller repeat protein [Verrucomicrobia subdivision 3 bacterium]|nr:PQQ-like beta-propeller repeat protein [Limisphaerales bacterium]
MSHYFWFALVVSATAALQGQDWPQFLGPARDGTYSGTNLAATWPKEGPPVLWRKNIGAGFSAPVAASGKVILFHRIDDKETVECFESKSGDRLWRYDYPTKYRDDFGFDEGPRGTPAIAGGRVYTCGAEGMLHCLEFASGKKLWDVDARKEFGARKGFFGIACSPLVEGNRVLVEIGGTKAGIAAFNAETGAVAWKTPGAEASYSSPTATTIRDKRCAFFFTREGLTALDAGNGKEYWQFAWRPSLDASVNAATPLVVGETIFVSTSYGRGAALLRFDERKPIVIWSGDEMLSNHYATSVQQGGFLYGYHGRQEQGCDLRCVELETGKVMWTAEGFGAGTVTLAAGSLLLLTEKGELVKAPATAAAFKPAARAQILGLQTRAHPALANGLFFARDRNRLVCVDLALRAP